MIPIVDDEIGLSIIIYVSDVEKASVKRQTKRCGDGDEGIVRLAQRDDNLHPRHIDDVYAAVAIKIGNDRRTVRNRHRC